MVMAAATVSACAEQFSGVSLNYNALLLEAGDTLESGETEKLTVTVIPAGYSQDTTVEWSYVAVPSGCIVIAVDEKEDPYAAEIRAVFEGVAIVTATVSTKFGSMAASCQITVSGGAAFGFNQKAALASVPVLNKIAPSGETDGAAHNGSYYSEWSGEQIKAFNEKSKSTDADNAVLAAYKAVKGNSVGAIIVKTATAGYYTVEGYEEAEVLMYTAIDKDGKLIGMRIFDETNAITGYIAFEDYFSEDDFDAFNAEKVTGKTIAAVTSLTVQDIEHYFTVKEGMFEAGSTYPTYTGAAFIKAAVLAAEVFNSVK